MQSPVSGLQAPVTHAEGGVQLVACWQPWKGTQVSVVQFLPSSQLSPLGTAPHPVGGEKTVMLHCWVVQGSKGTRPAQYRSDGSVTHPLVGSEVGSHGAHKSVVQLNPSSHRALIWMYSHPLAGLQVSMVQLKHRASARCFGYSLKTKASQTKGNGAPATLTFSHRCTPREWESIQWLCCRHR